MNKSTFFSGQPIFTQLLKFVSKEAVIRIAQQHQADRYSKRFNTYDHLVTMLYSIFNNCNSLREVATGMLASEQRLRHIGIRFHPRRSTISDANNRRQANVFGEIYYTLYKKYTSFSADSRKNSKASKLYIFDATTISLFQEVLRTSGKNPSGKRKGGIKVHTLIRSDQDVPCMIRYSAAAANDSQFLKNIFLPKGSILVFDRGYCDYLTFNRFADDDVTWVTRRRKQLTYKVLQTYKKADNDEAIISDQQIQLGWRSGTKVTARLIALWVISEAVAGGIVHGFHVPFGGMIVSGFAVVCICLIGYYSKTGERSTAYFAVFFQGLMGQILFSNLKYYRLSCMILGFLALVESAMQRVLVLIILYGTDFWDAVNDFIKKLFHVKEITNYSLLLAAGYIFIHAIVGIVIGMKAAEIIKQSHLWKNMNPEYLIADTDTGKSFFTRSSSPRKRKIKKIFFIIWIILILFFIQSVFKIGQLVISLNEALQIFFRSVLIFLTWYFLVSPLLTIWIKKRLEKQKRNQKMI